MMPTTPLLIDSTILYRSGYKYQLAADYHGRIDLRLPHAIKGHWFSIGLAGEIVIREGYAWDGPSGPTIDTPNFMLGSLVHDVLYQAIRRGLLSAAFKDAVDAELRSICREDGMSRLRAWYVWKAVQWKGHRALQGGPRPVLRAPRVKQPLRQLPHTIVPAGEIVTGRVVNQAQGVIVVDDRPPTPPENSQQKKGT